MCDFKSGDEVVCIKGENTFDANFLYPDVPALVTGRVYTIRAVVECFAEDGSYEGVGVQLNEVAWTTFHGMEGAYDYLRFRKVQKRTSSLSIETFLTIKPGFEEPRRVTTPAKERVS